MSNYLKLQFLSNLLSKIRSSLYQWIQHFNKIKIGDQVVFPKEPYFGTVTKVVEVKIIDSDTCLNPIAYEVETLCVPTNGQPYRIVTMVLASQIKKKNKRNSYSSGGIIK